MPPPGVQDFLRLLEQGSTELHQDNPDGMTTGRLLPTINVIDPGDVDLFFQGLDCGLITLKRGARFNTLDRPTSDGHWGLLSRAANGGWYNAEYLPQLAAYVDAIVHLAYPAERVFFELPQRALQLDLAIIDDQSHVVILGEAKRATAALEPLRTGALHRFSVAPPTPETKKQGDEQRQLAWRLWTARPAITWLIGPGHREAFRTETDPLRLTSLPGLPSAAELQLDHRPPRMLTPRLDLSIRG